MISRQQQHRLHTNVSFHGVWKKCNTDSQVCATTIWLNPKNSLSLCWSTCIIYTTMYTTEIPRASSGITYLRHKKMIHNYGCTDRSIYIQFLHQCNHYTETKYDIAATANGSKYPMKSLIEMEITVEGKHGGTISFKHRPSKQGSIPWICYERRFSEVYLSVWNQLVFNQRLQLFV